MSSGFMLNEGDTIKRLMISGTLIQLDTIDNYYTIGKLNSYDVFLLFSECKSEVHGGGRLGDEDRLQRLHGGGQGTGE